MVDSDSITTGLGNVGTVTDIGGGVITESGLVNQLTYLQGIVYVPASTISGRGTLQELLLVKVGSRPPRLNPLL
jgi:hypothetical protein